MVLRRTTCLRSFPGRGRTYLARIHSAARFLGQIDWPNNHLDPSFFSIPLAYWLFTAYSRSPHSSGPY